MSDLGYSPGLAGVIAGETAISYVNGEEGKLIYRGYNIEECMSYSFTEVMYLLIKGHFPSTSEIREIESVWQKYVLPSSVVQAFHHLNNLPAMVFLQSALSVLAESEIPNIKDEEANIKEAIRLIAAMTEIIGLYQMGVEYMPLRAKLGSQHLGQRLLTYLRRGRGNLTTIENRIFEKALILHMDHDFNASTFTARVVASTEARLASSISAAIGSLSGPLHGGANEAVMEMLKEVQQASSVEVWIDQALSQKRKVPGFGHRVYRTVDPRAVLLFQMLHQLDPHIEKDASYLKLKELHDLMIERLAKKQKDYINPNVDFWSGLLYKKLDIPVHLFTAIFAAARVVGWSAHIIEQWKQNRIFRPSARYIGPLSKDQVA